MDWAIDNHYRNEKNNKHIALLDDEINDLREQNEAHISRLNSEINILKGKNEALLHQIQKQKDETSSITNKATSNCCSKVTVNWNASRTLVPGDTWAMYGKFVMCLSLAGASEECLEKSS